MGGSFEKFRPFVLLIFIYFHNFDPIKSYFLLYLSLIQHLYCHLRYFQLQYYCQCFHHCLNHFHFHHLKQARFGWRREFRCTIRCEKNHSSRTKPDSLRCQDCKARVLEPRVDFHRELEDSFYSQRR